MKTVSSSMSPFVRRILCLASASLLLLRVPAGTAQLSRNILTQAADRPAGLADETVRSLARLGIGFQYQYVQDLSQAPLGAPGDHDWFSRYTWDVSATLDGSKALGWKGGSASVDLKEHVQEFGRLYGGVAQGYSNLDTDSHTALYAAWAQQSWLHDRLRVKGGVIDANTDFDSVATASDFLNSSMGYSPTIMEFPSYPKPMSGADIAVSLPTSTSLRGGEFATADGHISIAEAAQAWTAGTARIPGRASVGVWSLRAPISRFDGSSASGTSGIYSVLEQSLWHRPLQEAGGAERSLAAFLQLGTGNGRENPMTRHLGGGIVWSAPSRRRPKDAAGFAATSVGFTSASEAAYDAHRELVLEAYYKLQMTHSLAVVSDLQYFHHPGGILSRPDTFIATPRLVVTF